MAKLTAEQEQKRKAGLAAYHERRKAERLAASPPPDADEKLREENAELRKQIAAMQLAGAQVGYGDPTEETPTGKTKKVKILDPKEPYDVTYLDDGRVKKRPNFITVDEPTYFYRINLPPVGGMDVKTNGVAYEHGQTYEFTLDELRDVKSRVWQCWKHEYDIHHSEENLFRRRSEVNVTKAGTAAMAEIKGRMRG